jgi:hypothetical protein
MLLQRAVPDVARSFDSGRRSDVRPNYGLAAGPAFRAWTIKKGAFVR